MTDFKKNSKKADASATLQEVEVKATSFCIAPGIAITTRRGMLKEGDEITLDDCVSIKKGAYKPTPEHLAIGKRDWDKRLKRGDIIPKT